MNTARYTLMVDSGDRDDPPMRRFATYDAAIGGLKTLDDRWRRFACIYELDDEGQFNIIIKDGKVVAG